MSKALEESSIGGTTPTSSTSPPESKKREKTVPHYLRASTGSCHDLCKHGHRNHSEEELRFSRGIRKKLSTHLNNLALNRSAILDRSKDVRNRSLSLAKSSISLGEAKRVAPKLTSANRKGAASNEHLVLRTTTSYEHKFLNSDGSKKHSMVAEKAPTNLRYSNGVPKCDRKKVLPGKEVTDSAKVKVPERALPEKSRTVHRVTTVKHSLLKKPVSSSTDLNTIKKVPVTSQASSRHQHFSKDKSTPKGKVTSPSAAITRVRGKPGRSPMRSSNANTNGKESSDMSMSSFSMESKLPAYVEVQENLHVTGYSVESIPAQPSLDVTECVGNSQPAQEESCRSISDNDILGEKSEALACEASMEGETAIELQQSLDDKEFNVVSHESPEHNLAEHSVMDGRVLKDEDSQTDDYTLCQLPEELTTVENTSVYDPVLTQNNSKIEDDHVKGNICVESLKTAAKEKVGVYEDLQRSVETLALDEKHVEEPESCLDFASENAAENGNADEVLDRRTDNCPNYCNSISETSLDCERPEEPKSMLIVPNDATIQITALASASNETIELEVLKSSIIIPQLPEELSDVEFYEEYDFEFSESDESGTEDEEVSVNGIRDESVKASDQRPRGNAVLQLDNANATPYKLKFKRGKIVEVPPDSNGPRRLKFRRKAANGVLNSTSQSARKNYKRSSTSNVVPANPDVESSGVKLRHQDAQEKKDAQGLFNNVIEETASKLVESRKSKVKALVGAFETVISLQDGKPTSQAGNSQDSVHVGEESVPEEDQ
jgi:hypothetical protein